jgi:sirohydrochlorin cobaltochelatase
MPTEHALAAVLSDKSRFGQLLIQRRADGRFVVCHRDDESATGLKLFQEPEGAIEIARYDDEGKYRSLKTAPNLRHGWRLEVADPGELRRALDYIYPGRLAALTVWTENQLGTMPLRDTLNRQSGMYRVAAKIPDEQIDELVANFCRSDTGCLRTILWRRDQGGSPASTKLATTKFNPAHDQTGRAETIIPLLCQEACNLLVNECRKVVKRASNE